MEASARDKDAMELLDQSRRKKSLILNLPTEILLKILHFAIGPVKIHHLQANFGVTMMDVSASLILTKSTATQRAVTSACKVFRLLVLENRLRNKIPLSCGGTLRYDAKTDIISIARTESPLSSHFGEATSMDRPLQLQTEAKHWMQEVKNLAVLSGQWKIGRFNWQRGCITSVFGGSLQSLADFVARLQALDRVFVISEPILITSDPDEDVEFWHQSLKRPNEYWYQSARSHGESDEVDPDEYWCHFGA